MTPVHQSILHHVMKATTTTSNFCLRERPSRKMRARRKRQKTNKDGLNVLVATMSRESGLAPRVRSSLTVIMVHIGDLSLQLWTVLPRKQQFLSLRLLWLQFSSTYVDVGDTRLIGRRGKDSKVPDWVIVMHRTDLDTGSAPQSWLTCRIWSTRI